MGNFENVADTKDRKKAKRQAIRVAGETINVRLSTLNEGQQRELMTAEDGGAIVES